MAVESLPSSSEFDAVFKNPDAKFGRQDFLVLVRLNPETANLSRIGFVTSKKKIKRAVDRNRFRRVFKEILRSRAIHQSADYVVIARNRPDTLHESSFAVEVIKCFEKLDQLLTKNHAQS